MRSASLGGVGGGGWYPCPKAKPSACFPSWKFTLICSEVEHGALAASELNYAGASPREGVWGWLPSSPAPESAVPPLGGNQTPLLETPAPDQEVWEG